MLSRDSNLSPTCPQEQQTDCPDTPAEDMLASGGRDVMHGLKNLNAGINEPSSFGIDLPQSMTEYSPQINVGDIPIEPWECPPEYKDSQYDAALLYSENDEVLAIKFQRIINKYKFH